MRTLIVVTVSLLWGAGLAQPARAEGEQRDLERVVVRFTSQVKRGDVEGVMTHIPAEGLVCGDAPWPKAAIASVLRDPKSRLHAFLFDAKAFKAGEGYPPVSLHELISRGSEPKVSLDEKYPLVGYASYQGAKGPVPITWLLDRGQWVLGGDPICDI